MAILKRINKYQGLKDIDVLVEESGLSSQYFNIYDVPTNIPQGRSSFLLAGSSYLKNFVELKVEILDSAGQTVYTEPIANYLEGNARRVSIEVYDDTAPGDGFLYIVGELKDNFRSVSGQQQDNLEITDNFLPAGITGNDVPPDFKNIYNVRYIRPIFINTTIPNTEPIFFYQQPRVTVNEILKGYVVETTVSSSYEVTGSVSVDPIQGLEPQDPDPDPIDGYGTGMSDGARDEVGRQLEVFKNRRKNKIDPLRNNRFSKAGRLTRRASPEIDRFTISVTDMETSPENTTSDAVTSAFVGGEITINNPTVDSTAYPTDEYTIPTQYKSSIKKVNNENTLVPLDDFVITKKDTGEKVPVKIEQTANNVTMSVLPTPPQTISTTHFRSYADITVGNLHTFSGDVYKAKIYARSKGTLGDFEPVYDASIESPQVLIDAYSPTGFKNTGYFYTQSIVDNYWVTSSNSTATQDNSQFIDGVLISGSNAGFTPINSTVNAVEFNSSHSYNLETSVPYTVEFNAYYYKENKADENGDVTKQAELEVYLSGSALTGGVEDDHKLGKVVVGEHQDEGQVLGVHNTFTSAGSGTPSTHLKFKATSGRWIIQDILLRPHSETNFNPTYFRTIVPMDHPLPKKPDDYDFIVEFYDLNNNIAETISVSEDNTFAGAPQNIDGEDNLLSGSLFIGNTQGSGFEMAGASSAYIRSLTYEGFDKTIASSSGGFLMWSGSVGGRLSSSEDYDGVGLEIVDAHGATDRYLQFKTNPSTFKVQTDEFFLGSTSQFVSGSNGNIEISSSNFHLTPAGDVTMAGTINATAGYIGDWKIVDGQISGSNITLNADNSTIFKTDQGPGSDSGESFAQLKDEYYIDFTPEEESPDNYYIKMGPNFGVDKDGILFASGAKFEGSITASQGLIGGFTTDSHSMYSNNIVVSGSPDAGGVDDPKYMFISTSNFNVKENGDVTGSSVLFTGGKVGGFEIVTDGLSSVNNAFQVTGSTGQITGSNVLFTAGNIGKWVIENHLIRSAGVGGVRLNGNEGGAEISVNKHTFGNGPGIQLHYNSGVPQFFVGSGSNDYMKYTSAGIDIKTAIFELDTSALDLSSTHASMSLGTGQEVVIRGNSNSPYISLQPAEALVDKTYGGSGVFLGVAGGSTPLFSAVGSGGHVKFNGTGIDLASATFDLDAGTIIMDSGTNEGKIALGGTPPTAYNSGNGFYVDGTGKFLIGSGSGDHLQFDGTNFDVQVGSLELDATNIEISSTNASMSLGEGKILLDGSNDLIRVGSNASNNVKVVGTATQGYIHTGKTSAASTTAGFWLANNAGDPEFHVGNSTDYLKFDGGDLNITSQNLEISSSTIQVSTTQASMSLGHDNSNPYGKIIIEGSGTPTFRVGPSAQNLSLTAGSGIYIDGDGNFKFGDSDGQVKFQDGSFSITGSDVAINVTDINISASGFELSSTQASMSLGTNKQWVAFGGNTSPYLSVGQSTVGYGNSGVFLGYVNSVTRPRVSFVGSTGHFKVDQDVDIKTETFELDANTGDLQISSAHKSMSLNDGTIILDGPNKKIKVGSSNAVTIQGGGNGGVDNYIVMGSKADFSDYDKSTQGIIIGMDTSVPKFEMAKSSTNYLRWDTTSGLDLATEAMEVSASNIQISSAQASMSVGPSQTNPIVLQSLGNDRFLKFGGKTDFDQTGTAGFIMGIDNGTAKFDFTIGTGNNNYLRVDGSNVDIKTPNFKLDTTNLDIDSTTSRIQVFDGSAGERVRIGEISDSASDLYGFKIYDGSGTGDGNTLVKLGEEGNRIAGWTINQNSLYSNNIYIHSEGTLETADFASNVKGWRISADGNGTAEFENVRIRGTLATAVFEKETVNAVGGQLYVANSTSITGSASMSISETTMSVVNVTGFVANEVISAKKVSSTGFQTEYMLVNSASRDDSSSDTNFAGKLMVTRAYGSGSQGDFVGDLASASQSYEQGQVIVSTGVSGSGYIRLNANPNDTSSPYMDIVERTGSGIYDVEHKVRVGDLSGLSAGKLYGETNPGFGLYGENVFLSGSITATSGSIKGRMHITTSPSEEILLGTNVSGTDDGIYINNNNYWFTDATFKVGSSNYYLQNDASGNITIHPKTFELDADTGELQISSTQHSMSFNDDDILIHAKDSGGSHIKVGRNVDRAITISGSQYHGAIYSGKANVTDTTAGFWLANNNTDPEFHLGSSTNFVKYDGGALSMTTQTFELDAGTGDLQLSSGNTSMSFADNSIKIGATSAGSGVGYLQVGQDITKAIQITGSNTVGSIRSVKDSFTDNTAGFWIANSNGVQEFNVGTATQYIKFNSGTGNLQIASDDIQVTASNVDISTGIMKIDADDFQIDSTAPSMSLGYDTNANAGMTIVGGSPSLIGFGPKSGYNMELRSTTTDDHLKIGSRDFGSGSGIILGSDGGTYKLEMYRNASNYLTFSSAGDLSIRTDTFDLQGTNMALNNTRMYLGTIQSDSDDSGAGVYMDNGGAFRVQGNSTNYLRVDGGSMALATDDFSLDTAKGDIIFNSLVQRISMGASPPTTFTANGIILSGSGYFNFQKDQYNYIRHDSNGLGLASQELNVSGSTTFRLHGKSGGSQLRLGSSADDITATANTGIFMDSGAVFRVGEATSGDNFIYFNGSNSLQIKSTNFDLTAGTAGHGQLGVNTTRIALGSTLPTAYNSGTGFFVNNDGEFLLGAHGGDRIQFGGSGNITIVSSNMDITAGTFALDATELYISSANQRIALGADGSAVGYQGSGIFLGEDGSGVYKFSLKSASGDSFSWNGAGQLDITGNITADSGNIGGFIIDDHSLTTTGVEINDSTQTLFINTSNFDVSHTGNVTASNVDLSGKITATSGEIAGWTIDSTDGIYKLGDGTPGSSPSDGIVISTTGGANDGGIIESWDDNDILVAAMGDTTIGYGIYGIAGKIGGWTLSSTALTAGSTSTTIKLIPGTGIQMGHATFGSAPFSVTNAGVLKATSGTVGGWTLSAGELTAASGDVIIDSDTNNGEIRLGATPPSSATSGTGIYLGGDGTFLAGSASGNRIQFTSGGAIVLQSNTFALNTNTMILDSGVNSGNIRLGASGGPTSVSEATTRKGIYMDGTGDVLIKASSGSGEHFMKFTDAGLELKTANLEFTTGGDIISKEYLIERSRLFGSGVDGTIVLSDNSNGGSTYQDSTYGVNDANGTRILLNGPERASQGAAYGTGTENWHQLGDIYCENFTINSGVHLWTNGYRIFVRDTFTNSGTIRNDGFDGGPGSTSSQTGGTAGAGGGAGTGAPGGTLAPGVNGASGGAGGYSGGGSGQHGASGGGGGGSGGTILIFARILAGDGDVVNNGGDGGDGGDGSGYFA